MSVCVCLWDVSCVRQHEFSRGYFVDWAENWHTIKKIQNGLLFFSFSRNAMISDFLNSPSAQLGDEITIGQSGAGETRLVQSIPFLPNTTPLHVASLDCPALVVVSSPPFCSISEWSIVCVAIFPRLPLLFIRAFALRLGKHRTQGVCHTIMSCHSWFPLCFTLTCNAFTGDQSSARMRLCRVWVIIELCSKSHCVKKYNYSGFIMSPKLSQNMRIHKT